MLGAAAYWGHAKVLKVILSTLPQEAVDLPALESADRRPAKGGPFQPELNGYTPLMLAVVGP